MSENATHVVSADDLQNNPILTIFGLTEGDTLTYSITPAVKEAADVQESTTTDQEHQPDVQESETTQE